MWVRNSKVMVVGYDVSHPTNIKTSGNPSVVGVSLLFPSLLFLVDSSPSTDPKLLRPSLETSTIKLL